MLVQGPDTDRALGAVVAAALDRCGCVTTDLTLVQVGDPGSCAPLDAALEHADLVVDLRGGLRDLLPELAPEAKALCIDLDRVEDLDHLVAHPGLGRRAARLTDLLWASDAVRLESAPGASLLVPLEAARVRADIGVVTTRGEVAVWPSATVWCSPDPKLVTGTVVAMPGDIVSEAEHILHSPVRLEIDRGHLVEILGESEDADLLRVELEHAGEDAAYVLARVGIGLGLGRAGDRVGPFAPQRLAPGHVIGGAGNCTLDFGGVLSLTLTSATVTARDNPVTVDGSLAGSLVPDVYERAAAG